MLFEPLNGDSLRLCFWHIENESEIGARNFDWGVGGKAEREPKERTCQLNAELLSTFDSQAIECCLSAVNRIFQIGGNHAHSAVSGSGDGCREAPLD